MKTRGTLRAPAAKAALANYQDGPGLIKVGKKKVLSTLSGVVLK